MKEEYRCFIGGLSWSTTDRSLESAFRPYGPIVEAKVVYDRELNRSRGFGFVTYEDEESMENAIEKMHNQELEGRSITVSKADPKSGAGGGGRGGGDRDRERDRVGGGGGYDRGRSNGASGDCFKCGRRGHWARDCPENGGGGGGGRDRDRGSRERDRDRDRDRDRYGSDRYGSDRGDKYTGGDSNRGSGGRYSGDRGGDRYGSRDNGRRSGPYDRPSKNGSRDDRY